MKQPIWIIVFLVLSAPAFALPAGSSISIATFDQCDTLHVNVTGFLVIDDGEYDFMGCDEIDNNTWRCDCHDGYTLEFQTLPNAINNYTFDVHYNYSNGSGDFSETVESTGGSGGRGGLDNVGPITIVTDDDSDDEEPVADEPDDESEGGVSDELPATATGSSEDDAEASASEEPPEAPQATGAVTGGDAGGLGSEWFWLFGALGLVLVLFGAYGVVKRRQR